MSSEMSLTWNDHHQTLVGVFEKLLETNTLVDCTIAAEGQYLRAHKIILSACSPYFQLLFSQESEKNPIVVLKDIKFQELKAMIDFIYRGKVKVPKERLKDFVDAAESLQIKGVGNDSHKMSLQNIGNEGSNVRNTRSGRISPLPHKRLRHTGFGDSIKDTREDVSPLNAVDFEEQSREIRVVPPSVCQDEASLTLCRTTDNPMSLPSNVCSEIRNFETSESVPLVRNPLLQCDEIVPNPDVVVKSEPEDMAEVYIAEMECFIEPKEEDIAEDSESEDTGRETNSPFETNRFPNVSAMPQVTPTKVETILVPQGLEATSSLAPGAGGAAKRRRWKPRSSEMVMVAIKSLRERGGSSLQAIKKFIASKYKVDPEKYAPFIRKYLKGAVAARTLVQTTGRGASGSFKLGTKAAGAKAAKAAQAQTLQAQALQAHTRLAQTRLAREALRRGRRQGCEKGRLRKGNQGFGWQAQTDNCGFGWQDQADNSGFDRQVQPDNSGFRRQTLADNSGFDRQAQPGNS